ncbi:MAG TPA: membrane-associated protein [Vicinamibacteria bacterium]|nr:membrane-associated protein [Vicinamibacteria bacterium]
MSAAVAPRAPGPAAFPRLRWAALGWLVVWGVAYARGYGFANFLQLCDVAVIVTCLGLWLGSPLLLSSQAVSSLVVDLAWDLDLLWRAATGSHLIGGTEYMWDPNIPLGLRLLSAFHVVWPPLLWWALRRVGYDRRALALQSAVAVVALALSRVVMPEANLNFAQRDPFLGRSWGPAPVHLGLTLAVLIGVVYWPTHTLLRRVMPRPRGS